MNPSLLDLRGQPVRLHPQGGQVPAEGSVLPAEDWDVCQSQGLHQPPHLLHDWTSLLDDFHAAANRTLISGMSVSCASIHSTQAGGPSIYNLHIMLRFFYSRSPSVRNIYVFYCLSTNLGYFLPPPLTLLCGRHIWNPTVRIVLCTNCHLTPHEMSHLSYEFMLIFRPHQVIHGFNFSPLSIPPSHLSLGNAGIRPTVRFVNTFFVGVFRRVMMGGWIRWKVRSRALLHSVPSRIMSDPR